VRQTDLVRGERIDGHSDRMGAFQTTYQVETNRRRRDRDSQELSVVGRKLQAIALVDDVINDHVSFETDELMCLCICIN
jgi:hypothetical protein